MQARLSGRVGIVGSSFVVVGLLGALATSAKANSPPVVSNVTGSQRTDGSKLVDIRYDLADADADACTVTVQASSDNGATWSVPITAVTGAVGPGIAPGVGKHIVWDCAPDVPGAFGSQYKVRVYADDGHTPVMVLIPAGEYLMGDSFNDGWSEELPRHAVYIDAFYMDTYEVTNQQYAAALNWAYAQGGLITVTSGVVYMAGSGTDYWYCSTTSAPTGYPHNGECSRITWNGSTFGVVVGKESHPMVQVSWYGSAAYANWRSAMQGKPLCYDLSTWTCSFGVPGYRLPTEAEWEKAARGGAAGHRFPWSDTDTIQHARANYYSLSGYSYDTSPTRGYHPTFNTGVSPYTSPVGYFAPNGYGLYDMAGNVWEWCNDWYVETYYSSSPPYNNPHGPASESTRVLRGGAWNYLAPALRCAVRSNNGPDGYAEGNAGFRLALDGGSDSAWAVSAPFTIDNRPRVSSLTSYPTEANYTNDSTFWVAVKFTEPVAVDTAGGVPTLRLATGPEPGTAVYDPNAPDDPNNQLCAGQDTVCFRYDVVPGDLTPHVDCTGPSALALNGATIIGQFSQLPADVTVPVGRPVESLGAKTNLKIATTKRDLKIDSVAAFQVVDVNSSDPSFPLVAGKQVCVRAYVTWTGDNQDSIGPLSGDLVVKQSGQTVRHVPAINQGFRAKRATSADNEDDRLNFTFRAPDTEGPLEITATVTPQAQAHITDINPNNNFLTVTRQCERTRAFIIGYVPVSWQFPPLIQWYSPVADAIRPGRADTMVRGFLPASALTYVNVSGSSCIPSRILGTIEFGDPSTHAVIQSWLDGLRLRQRAPDGKTADFLVGWWPTQADFRVLGTSAAGYSFDQTGRSRVMAIRAPSGDCAPAQKLAHEVGHLLGICHPDSLDCPTGAERANPYIGAVGVNLTDQGCQRWCSSDYRSLMTQNLSLERLSWIDCKSYRRIRNHAYFQRSGTRSAAQPMLLVTGAYVPSGPAVVLGPVDEVVTEEWTEDDPAGGLVIRAYHGTGGGESAVYAMHMDAGSSECETCPAGFSVLVPPEVGDPPQRIDRIEIGRTGLQETLASITRSPNSPMIQFVSPAPGATLTTGTVISWSGSDLDGDALQYALTYSWNGTQATLPLAAASTDTSVVFDTEAVPGSNPGAAKLTLTATDGMNTVSAELPNLTVDAKKAPEVHITAPADGTQITVEAPLTAEAAVHDPEDGDLPDGSIQWVSDIAGMLGTGATLAVDTLGVGTHHITVTATDSDQMAASDSVTVEIVARATARVGDLDFDDDVDEDDTLIFLSCFTGTNRAFVGEVCHAGDLDGDGDVDCHDQALFIAAFSGPGTPPVPCFIRGDTNCDGLVDFDDIGPFVAALVDRAAYEACYPGCRWLTGDANCDGSVDFNDINPFVACLVAGGCECPRPIVRGDLNCDGSVDFNDINAFVTALVGQAGYEAQYPNCNYANADCNHDGRVDFDDIDPFVSCLVGGKCP